MKRQLLTGVLAASTLTLAAFSQATPAHALSFSGGTVNLTANDVGSTFQVNFDGNVNGNNVPGLSAQALFTLTSYATNQANFTVNLINTTTVPITSRISRLGFNTNPGVNVDASSATGVFTDVITGSFPNKFGDVEVCFVPSSRGTCGGGPGGVTTTGNFTTNLVFTGSLTNGLSLSDFGVRYQSINGGGFDDASGTGRGTPIPTPALLPAVLGMGAAVLRKKKQEAKVAEKV
ncbi:cistern family PEP-CTERM protein [Cyanobacteria bacterium FACHB-DQ100]|nr:cistern family PEP-CTERM protein [Cyanobacteria bacterium FACHB-DQ100]